MIPQWEPSTWLTLLNTLLIVITILLGIQTTIFQRRTSLRESLEQLDPIEFGSSYIGVFLYEFNYIPFLHKSVVLKIYVRDSKTRGGGRVGSIHDMQVTLSAIRINPDYFFSYELVEDVWSDKSGLYIRCRSLDGVKCRKVAEHVLTKIQNAVDENVEHLK